MTNQCKCGSLDFFIEKQGNNTGLYCSMCGKWQKWMNKDEIRLFEHNHKPKKKNETKQTWGDKIRSMNDEELAEFLDDLTDNCCRCAEHQNCGNCQIGLDAESGFCDIKKWLQSEAE